MTRLLAERIRVLGYGVGPTVMLRTELDPLPVLEKTGLPFASTVVVKGASGNITPVAHACGHDLHMSAWFGTARLMAQNRERWHGTLVLVGQPAEEGLGGAAAIIKDGLFARFPKPVFALSVHDEPSLPAAELASTRGTSVLPPTRWISRSLASVGTVLCHRVLLTQL